MGSILSRIGKVGLLSTLLVALPQLCRAEPVLGEYPQAVVVQSVLQTGTTASGQPIVYPKTDSPEVRILMVDIPPGTETGWHRHPMPCYAYVLSGSVTVELKNGTNYTFHAGEGFAETVGTLHNGKNTGKEPVKLVMTVTGAKGVPTTERAKSK